MVVQQGAKAILLLQRYFISLGDDWIYIFWSMLLVLEAHCSGRPSHTIAEGAASLVPLPCCLQPWKAAAIHAEHCSPCILCASFDQPFND